MKYKLNKEIYVLILTLFIFSNLLYAQDSTEKNTDTKDTIVKTPEPFSIDARSAIYCINLLKNNRYLEKQNNKAKYNIIEVKTVWSWFIKYDESFPEGYRKRYDIIVNGNNMDWDNSYIEYGGKMINLKILFLYRNQYPPESLKDYIYN
ncbi:MAG: hypothetical protein PQJ46_01015 [Spirochaetales bacterium]|nr:hypothetical protein [Spirochaetales bacterium]